MTLLAVKTACPKVLIFAFAGDLIKKKLKFWKVFQDKDRCFSLFNFKNDHFYYKRLLNSKIVLGHLSKKVSIISLS